jgi:hypothetical protein
VREHPYAPSPQKSEGLGVFSPAVPRDEDVDDLAVALEERVEVVGRGACQAKEEEEAVREKGRARLRSGLGLGVANGS